MNLILFALVSVSQAQILDPQAGGELLKEAISFVAKQLAKCTIKVASKDGETCVCDTATCKSTEICRDGTCVTPKNAIRKECTAMDRCAAGQGRCTADYDCQGHLICGLQSCGAVRLDMFKETAEEGFKVGYISGVQDQTLDYKNDHCCCDPKHKHCRPKTDIPYKENESCTKERECKSPYKCQKKNKLPFEFTCQRVVEFEEEDFEYRKMRNANLEDNVFMEAEEVEPRNKGSQSMLSGLWQGPQNGIVEQAGDTKPRGSVEQPAKIVYNNKDDEVYDDEDDEEGFY